MVTSVQELLQSRHQEEENYVLLIHHALMKTYGWIPFDEFKELSIPTVMNLIDRINVDVEAENRAYEKAKNRK